MSNRSPITRRQLLRMGIAATCATAGPSLVQGQEAYSFRRISPAAIRSEFRRQQVASPYREPAGTVVIDCGRRLLHVVLGDGGAIRYGVGVGRAGFAWSGVAEVGRKVKWPAWTPTERMLASSPGFSYTIDGGPGNPLGARALYLYSGGKDTLYRLHGGGDERSIGRAVSSGCIRLLDQDIVELYEHVPLGAKVVVNG